VDPRRVEVKRICPANAEQTPEIHKPHDSGSLGRTDAGRPRSGPCEGEPQMRKTIWSAFAAAAAALLTACAQPPPPTRPLRIPVVPRPTVSDKAAE
jgi:hypothetical protein